METKKLQQQELQQIEQLRQKNQAILIEFGQIELIKIDLEDRTKAAKQYLAELREEEQTLAQYLQSTYGEGTVDLDKGEFIPTK